ncbi:MAG: tRNA preQ1(34) S-adenosylmethionine ribosyltransferase-isomerase QueA [Marinilabiliales bacterium]|nr:MAG: tRNA preQ1(34) S-adenosylmethionine ribosyltransferase-isomerase QueA [Marinilabiliales bacterium]
MKLSDFKFDLPKELIAHFPPENRDESRLMVIDRNSGKIEHKSFSHILDCFNEGDVMVVNNTKVFPARMFGRKEKTGAIIEVFLLRELNPESKLWDVLVDPARKIRIGNKLYFGENDELVAEVIDNTTSRGRTLRFLTDMEHGDFKALLQSLGEPPLPKIINRPVIDEDKDRYQTIYAKHEGAVAAPTAGLHFSRELIKKLEIKGINIAEITLHAGLGNFRRIEVEDLSKHKMDSEEFIIEEKTASIVNKAKDERRQVIAVGTTSMRAIESSVTINGRLKAFKGWTNKFIFPPYEFNLADSMISNLHLPQSSMMMMVAAYTGYDLLMEAYEVAVKEKYQFFTYGDAMLII